MATNGPADGRFSSFEVINNASDDEFGYDFSLEDEEALVQLASQASPSQKQPVNRFATAESCEEDETIDKVPGKTEVVIKLEEVSDDDDFEYLFAGRGGKVGWDHLQKPGQTRDSIPPEVESRHLPAIFTEVAYPDLSQAISKPDDKLPEAGIAEPSPTRDMPEKSSGSPSAQVIDTETEGTKPHALKEDTRSPLQRFRAFPRRPLTVTDLTSGAWCELQQWYTLTRTQTGRRTRTAAMKEGSKLHKKLEDEVHTTVRVEVMSKEDGFGLKLWNFVQGLRTLRESGLTRELEVWGVVDGEVVNGVIDGLTFTNPDENFEEELRASQEETLSQRSQSGGQQAALTDYFPPAKAKEPQKKVYLFDVKTRGTMTPVSKAMLRPAKVQLMLYRRFLADMAADKLDYSTIFRRYGLDQDAQFSDTFFASMASLNQEALYDTDGEHFVDAPQSQADTTSQLESLTYPTLRSLTYLLRHELSLTFPQGAASLGYLLRVQYLYRGDGKEIDRHVFPASEVALDGHLTDYMPWWRGERRAEGVQIEEAFKCRSCEFAGDCEWRGGMDERMRERGQKKARSRKSIV